MRLTIVEPEASGHHMILYLRCISQEAMRRGWQLHLVTTERATKHPAYQIVRTECGDALQTSIMPHVEFPVANPSPLNLLRFQRQQFRALADAYQGVIMPQRPDVIYVIHLDHFDKMLSVLGTPFGRTPFAGMLLSPRFHHRHMGIIGPETRRDLLAEQLFHWLLRLPTLYALTVINRPLVEYAQQRKFRGYEKIHYIPDVGSLVGKVDRNTARESLGIRDDQSVILVYGALSPRKGIRELLGAISDSSCPETVAVLLAGSQDEATQELLNTPDNRRLHAAGRLIVMQGFLNDEQEYLAFRASDVVWLGYRGFYGMSGVLVQAGMMELPIIACREGIIGWMALQNGLGEIVDVSDHLQVIHAISRFVETPSLRSRYGSRGTAMAQDHTSWSFGFAVCDAIASVAP
jgi:glycosyltransferase involved in cell wall biosynthesis